MVKINNIGDISLNQNEYCFLVGWQHYANSSFRVKIPKLMNSVTSPMNDPFNRNILINSKDCKPSVNNTLGVKDYVTIKRSQQCSLGHRIGNK